MEERKYKPEEIPPNVMRLARRIRAMERSDDVFEALKCLLARSEGEAIKPHDRTTGV